MSIRKPLKQVRVLTLFPFHFDRSANALSLSETEKLVRTGLMSSTDRMSPKGYVSKIVFKIKDSLYVWELSENDVKGKMVEEWSNHLVFDSTVHLYNLTKNSQLEYIHERDSIRVMGTLDLVYGGLNVKVVEQKFHKVVPSDVIPYYYEMAIYRDTYPEEREDPLFEAPEPIPEESEPEPSSSTSLLNQMSASDDPQSNEAQDASYDAGLSENDSID